MRFQWICLVAACRRMLYSFFRAAQFMPLAVMDGLLWKRAHSRPCKFLSRHAGIYLSEIDLRIADLDLVNCPLSLVGFSQGGAAVYTLSTLYPDRIERAAVLASFLPDVDDEENLLVLKGKPFFVTHGTRDDTIPVAYARQSIGKLERAGAMVEYCEADVGHKLAANCMKRLTDFLSQ